MLVNASNQLGRQAISITLALQLFFDCFPDDSHKNYDSKTVFLKSESCDLHNLIGVINCFYAIYSQFYQFIDRSLSYSCPADLSFPGTPFLLGGLKS